MTPEERNLVTELFDRLATLEDAERDPGLRPMSSSPASRARLPPPELDQGVAASRVAAPAGSMAPKTPW